MTLLQHKHMEWISIGAFAKAEPLVVAVTELTSAGVSWADLCLAGAPSSIERVAAAPEVESLDPLRALLKSVVKARWPGPEIVAVLAVPGCVGNRCSFVSAEMAERLRGPIIDGCILLGVPSANATDAASIGRILLRHSSRHVHVLQCRSTAPEQESA
jgi:hypothetical protein